MAINLSTTNHVLRITTDGTEAIDVVAAYADWVSATPFTPGSKETLITTATTTTIVAAPAASTVRMVRSVTITNTSTTSANVIINVYDGTNDHEQGTFDIGQDEVIVYDGQGWSVNGNFALQDYPCNGRLTLTSGTAVTTSDVTAATNWYFTPYNGNKIALYDTDSSRWKLYTFTEKSLAVVASTNTNYDLFLYDNSGTLTLEAVAWTNDTTRATTLTLQDGIYCKTGSLGRRYLGTVRTTGTSGQCEDSSSNRYVWNYYNRVLRKMLGVDGTPTWSYTSDTWRQANNSTAAGVGRVQYVCGVSEDLVKALVDTSVYNATDQVWVGVGVGVDATTVNSASTMGGRALISPNVGYASAAYAGYPGIGYHYLQRLEISAASGTTTWLGDNNLSFLQSGMTAEILA